MCDDPRSAPDSGKSQPCGIGFLVELSHEVRSPLNAIIGFSEMLGDGFFGPLSGQQHEVVQDILTAGRHLQQLVSDVLDISRIEMGKLDLNVEVLSVSAVVEQALAVARGMAPPQANLFFAWHLPQPRGLCR